MKRLVVLAIGIILFSCEPRQGKSVEDAPPSTNSNLHEIVVKDIIQAKNYTYVKALEQDKEIWMAILKTDIEVGETYYYDRAMEMKNFKSKDLNRSFDSVYFLEGLFENPDDFTKKGMMAPKDKMHQQKNMEERQEINIELEKDVTSIGNLYADKEDLENEIVIVKGVVTKFNPNIMNKNWVHIQDGTGGKDNFDLTITTLDNVKVGSIVKFQGTVAINKDFGHGYKYDLLLEKATQLNKQSEIKVN